MPIKGSMSTRCLYAILGLPRDASRKTIRSRYLELAKESHPDRHHGTDAEPAAREVFERVQAAYNTLYDPALRQAYDLKRFATLPSKASKSSVRTMPSQGVHKWTSSIMQQGQFASKKGRREGPNIFKIGCAVAAFQMLPVSMFLLTYGDDGNDTNSELIDNLVQQEGFGRIRLVQGRSAGRSYRVDVGQDAGPSQGAYEAAKGEAEKIEVSPSLRSMTSGPSLLHILRKLVTF
eukprot:gnl/MRDRNA2_/MRDRNA2_76953_c0_seq1.p1 gnl/MRDRNA2_/MRDRNA2_76953_c0~~gnl/MRDRNA2_/MRDRNA2_76953_c0_seq1.p1  ORF type:complete len:234 (-),score=50.28 gnl/MRDRNA2_/MRDRNA2_76953_c0_seq1:187-888(-)